MYNTYLAVETATCDGGFNSSGWTWPRRVPRTLSTAFPKIRISSYVILQARSVVKRLYMYPPRIDRRVSSTFDIRTAVVPFNLGECYTALRKYNQVPEESHGAHSEILMCFISRGRRVLNRALFQIYSRFSHVDAFIRQLLLRYIYIIAIIIFRTANHIR